MTMTPLFDRVIIRREQDDTQTLGGIALLSPSSTNRGTVVATGPGAPLPNGGYKAMAVTPGDLVLFGPFAGCLTVKHEGEDLLVMYEHEILAVVEDAQ
jgi:chaperonin GroES